MKRFVLTLVLGMFSIGANAALVDGGNYTTDTLTGYDWLDMTPNIGISYSTMQSTGLNGYASQGFRYATIDEITTLMYNAGADTIVPLGTGSSSANAAASALLIDHLGLVFINISAGPGVQGLSADFSPGGYVYLPWIRNDGVISMGDAARDITYASIDTSSWLVRTQVVPIPAAVWLFGSGLGFLGWFCRKRTK